MKNILSIEEINKLESENEIIAKQYNSLLKQYNEVLKLAKENADSNEYCLQELENKVERLTDTLKRIRNLVQGHKVADEVRLKGIMHYIDEVLE